MANVFFQAPGEAEAELAQLNQNGIVDAVLSDDSDTFVFGANTVIRKYAGHATYVYTANAASTAPTKRRRAMVSVYITVPTSNPTSGCHRAA